MEATLKRELEVQNKIRRGTLTAKPMLLSSLLEMTDSPETVAAQLKIIELEKLSTIGPEEFVQTFVRGSNKEVGAPERTWLRPVVCPPPFRRPSSF